MKKKNILLLHLKEKLVSEKHTNKENKVRAMTICLKIKETKREQKMKDYLKNGKSDKVDGTNDYLASVRLLNVSDKLKMLSGL